MPKPPAPRTPMAWGPSAIDLAHRRLEWFPSDSNDPFPLDFAIRENRMDEVRRLLEGGANPNLRWGQTGDHFPLQEALDSGGNLQPDPRELVPLLLKHGADPNAKWCPFESRGKWEWGPHCTSPRGATALQFAAMYDSNELAEQLLQAGADASVRDWTNASALDYAYDAIVFETISRALFPDIATRDRKALVWLTEYDGRWNGTNAWESTPLARALGQIDGGRVPPPPPIPIADLNKARSLAQQYQSEREGRMLERVRTLIRIGADPNERATRGGADWTPIAMALHRHDGSLRSARLLLANGADPNSRTCVRIISGSFSAFTTHGPAFYKNAACTLENGTTPLIFAAGSGDLEAVKLLLEFKADRSLRDWNGRSALDYATAPEVRKLLSAER